MEACERDLVERIKSMEVDECGSRSAKIAEVLRRFLGVQQRRAEAYGKLRRYPSIQCFNWCDHFLCWVHEEESVMIFPGVLTFDQKNRFFADLRANGFTDYMNNGGELAYQQLCKEITTEFNDCSKQVLEMESMLMMPELCRDDLADILKSVQAQEKQKLHLTARIQILKKAGRPSERLVSHRNCRFRSPTEHGCVNVHEITEAAGTEDAEADAEYDAALKETLRGVQDAVTSINDHLEEVRYEIEAVESEY